MAIVELIRCGHVKHLVSQNTDGLHLMSGVSHHDISELHGNTNKESCPRCKAVFFRDFRCRTAKSVRKHATGRLCDQCGGPLYDSIINFGESLPKQDLKRAEHHSRLCDLALVVGTSMKVTPAADLPLMASELVICNLQKTPADDECSVRLFAKSDEFFESLFRCLNLEIPSFCYEFGVEVCIQRSARRISFSCHRENHSSSLSEIMREISIECGNEHLVTMNHLNRWIAKTNKPSILSTPMFTFSTRLPSPKQHSEETEDHGATAQLLYEEEVRGKNQIILPFVLSYNTGNGQLSVTLNKIK